MIPKILHFIWFGKLKIPQKVIDSWEKMHPNYEIIIWNEKNIFHLKNQKIFDDTNKLNEKSDIARYEILYNYGGFYIDCDIICVKNIDELLNIENDFFCLYEKKNLVSNSVIGCSKNNEIIKKVYESLPTELDNTIAVWERTGPLFFTNIINENGNIKIFPHYYFNICRDFSHHLLKKNFKVIDDMKHRKNKDLQYYYDENNIFGLQLWMGSKKYNYKKLENVKNEIILGNLKKYLSSIDKFRKK